MGMDHTPLLAYLRAHIDELETIALSSNRILRLPWEGGRCIVKQEHRKPEERSPFWFAMDYIFQSNFASQRRSVAALAPALCNPHIPVAGVICTDETLKVQVFEEMEGRGYAPDTFPEDEGVLYQLGQYLGFLHGRSWPAFGCWPSAEQPAASFGQRLLEAMESILERYWQGDERAWTQFRAIRGSIPAPTAFHLMMTDLSANQFVYDEGLHAIRGVVDLDAYVVGPREWELTILELCLPEGSAFRRGYERYGALPDLSGCRDVYRFFSYLCDPWERADLSEFLARPKLLER